MVCKKLVNVKAHTRVCPGRKPPSTPKGKRRKKAPRAPMKRNRIKALAGTKRQLFKTFNGKTRTLKRFTKNNPKARLDFSNIVVEKLKNPKKRLSFIWFMHLRDVDVDVCATTIPWSCCRDESWFVPWMTVVFLAPQAECTTPRHWAWMLLYMKQCNKMHPSKQSLTCP
jgi:hypothetical protein